MGLSQRLGDSFKLVRRCGIFVYASFKLAKRDRKSFYQACTRSLPTRNATLKCARHIVAV